MKRTLLIFLFVFILMQTIIPEQTNPKSFVKNELKAPKEIMDLFKTSCYDCHSNKTVWPLYASIAPISWIINARVKNGRASLNFEEWENYSKEEKQKNLKDIYRTVYKAMPMQSYLNFHEEKNLSKKQREKIRTWTGVRK